MFYLFSKKHKSLFRPLAIAILLSAALLSFSEGKQYYFYPIILTLLPFGGVFWEQIVFEKRKWIFYPVTALLLLGCVLIPFGMPVYTFKHYLAKVYPLEKANIEGGKYAVNYDEYFTKEKWQTTMQDLKVVYDSLPPAERKDCLIWGKHYGQAGAINLFRDQYNLPPAFSYHGSFYSWTPKGEMPETVIALSYRIGDFFEDYFGEITKVRTIYNPYSANDEELYQYIYICKKPKQSFDKLKELFKNRIFE